MAADINELVTLYFKEMPFTVRQISIVLRSQHGIIISERHIKRILKKLGLKRRGPESSLDRIVDAFIYEIQHGCRNYGIRLMQRQLSLKHNMCVKRQTVRDIMEAIDPDGISPRAKGKLSRRVYKNRGPNHIIHIDGYDKLSQFGFCIHGAMDGWSRKVLWLKIGRTNKKPSVVANNFLEYVQEINGVPEVVRMDPGTENCLVADLQCLLKESTNINSNFPPFIYGSSVRNQRIEKFWQFVHSHFAIFWQDLFKDLEITGVFNSTSFIDKALLQFCFTPILRLELDKLVSTWNSHTVRKMKNTKCPSGVPDSLYLIPGYVGKNDQKIPVEMDLVQMCKEINDFVPESEYGCDDELLDVFLQLMLCCNLSLPSKWTECLQLYGHLKIAIENT